MAKSPLSCICLRKPFHSLKSLPAIKRQKLTLLSAFLTCFAVFVINLLLVILAYTRLGNSGPDDYVKDLYSGDCDMVKRAGIGAHFVINILSTLMLWASNLALQLAGAPTRKMIDIAHKKGDWLDIGIVSMRNLWSIPKKNLAIWAVLCFSSLPIHFLYNSVVFNAITTNNYILFVVTEPFFHDGFTNRSISGYEPLVDSGLSDPLFSRAMARLEDSYRNQPQTMNLSILECLQAYDNPFQYRPNLFLVTKQRGHSNMYKTNVIDDNLNRTVVDVWKRTSFLKANFFPADLCTYAPASFTDEGYCGRLFNGLTLEEAHQYMTPGPPWEFFIDYCMVDRTSESQNYKEQHECHLQCSPPILLVVVAFNALKCLCILWVIAQGNSLGAATIGDAIAEFLERPDQYTKSFGVSTKAAIYATRKHPTQRIGTRMIWRRKAERWWRAASTGAWATSLISLLLVIGTASAFVGQEIMIQKLYNRNASIYGLWKLGFGSARKETIISWNQRQSGIRGLLENLIIANIWQVLVSILYLSFTAIFTSQLIAREWASYASERKYLRVSIPSGCQRSTYFISIPYRYGVPVIAIFTVEHWLLSQSTFIIRLLTFDADGKRELGHTTAGFSIIPSLFALILALLIFSIYILNSLIRRYPSSPRMPLVATNSLAISANCHPPPNDTRAYIKRVQWGLWDSESGRCSFTSQKVEKVHNETNVVGLDKEIKGRKE